MFVYELYFGSEEFFLDNDDGTHCSLRFATSISTVTSPVAIVNTSGVVHTILPYAMVKFMVWKGDCGNSCCIGYCTGERDTECKANASVNPAHSN